MLESLAKLFIKKRSSGAPEEIMGFSMTKALQKPTILIPIFAVGYIVVKKPTAETFKNLIKSPFLIALTLMTAFMQFSRGHGFNLPDAVSLAKNLLKGHGLSALPNGGSIFSRFLPSSGSSGTGTYTGETRSYSDALKKSASEYGVEYARLIEKAVRNETAHFTSGQWKGCNTPGMEAAANEYPWGWTSLERYARMNGLSESDFYLKTYTDNHTGLSVEFVGFPTPFHGVDFMSWFLQDVRGGNVYKWKGLTESAQMEYKRRIDPIKTSIV